MGHRLSLLSILIRFNSGNPVLKFAAEGDFIA